MQLINNKKALSPVIGIIFTVAILVSIAIIILNYSTDVPEKKSLVAIKLNLEYDLVTNDKELTITHMGGSAINDAYTSDGGVDNLRNLVIKINSEEPDVSSISGPTYFAVGDELIIVFTDPLNTGDIIKIIQLSSQSIVHTETI